MKRINRKPRHPKKENILRRIGHISQLVSLKKYRFDDGPALGMRAIEVQNSTGLSFTILPDRGMDISHAKFKGINLSYITSRGEISPQFYEPQGLGWLNTFTAGLLTTCGLTHFGPPSDENNTHYGLHGRYSTIPAQKISDNSGWQGDEYTIELSGVVEEARLFGDKLRLSRTIKCPACENRIIIIDKIENFGYKRTPYMIMYHFNFGYPFLSENCIIKINSEKSFPRDEIASAGFKDFAKFAPPTKDFKEQVFFHKMKADKKKQSFACLVNPELKLSLEIKFNTDSLPYLTQWNMCGEGDYVLGLEPCNAPCMDREKLKEQNLLQYLEPGEEKINFLEISIQEL